MESWLQTSTYLLWKPWNYKLQLTRPAWWKCSGGGGGCGGDLWWIGGHLPALQGQPSPSCMWLYLFGNVSSVLRGLAYLKTGRSLNLYVNSAFPFLPWIWVQVLGILGNEFNLGCICLSIGLSFYFLIYSQNLFWLCRMVCGILVLQPGIEPAPLASEGQS